MACKVFQNSVGGTLTLIDGTDTTPLEVEVDTTVGDLSISGPLKATLHETVDVMVRNRHGGVAVGARIFPTLTFSCQVDAMSGQGAGDVLDFLMAQGDYLARKSTCGDDDPFFHCNVQYENGADTFLAEDVEIALDSFAESGEVNTFSFTGTVRGAIQINGKAIASEAP